MSNATNIGFKRGPNTLYLYLHWGLDNVERSLANALLAAIKRWDDPAYATRQVIQSILADAEITGKDETGAGLEIDFIGENDYDYIWIVDFEEGTVVSEKGHHYLYDFVEMYSREPNAFRL